MFNEMSRSACLFWTVLLLVSSERVTSFIQISSASFVPVSSFTVNSMKSGHVYNHVTGRNSILYRPSSTSLTAAVDPATVSTITTLLLSYEESQSIDQLQNTQIEQLSATTTLFVFIIGIIPFIWATIEFWRRIAFGESFGTGKDSVIIPRPGDEITIGEDGNPESSRGRRTLDRGALTVAYVLFAVAAGSVGIAIASVVMGPRPDM